MSILKEKYSLAFIEKHLTGVLHKWDKDVKIINTEVRNINGDMQMTDRMIKIAGVIQTNPRYIELYNNMQKNMETRQGLSDKISKAREVLKRIADVKGDRRKPYLYDEGTMELTLADKLLYEITEDSDLYGV